jgi:aldose 1-epimerase
MLTFAVDAERGCRLSSLAIDGVERLVQRDPSTVHDVLGWGSYPMVPFAGRIRDGRFTFAGTDYELPADLLPPHAIHGCGFDHPWTEDDDGDYGIDLAWPLGGRATQRFELSDDDTTLTITMSVTNDERPMPCEIGWHPWFAKPVELLWVPGAMYRRDDTNLPDGDLLRPPPPGPYDDCFTDVPQPIWLRFPDAATLAITSSCHHWVVYDQLGHATCVEPQSGPPDAVNSRHRHVVAPGAPMTHWMRLQVR